MHLGMKLYVYVPFISKLKLSMRLNYSLNMDGSEMLLRAQRKFLFTFKVIRCKHGLPIYVK